MTDIEHAKKYAEDSISLAISMSNPKAEMIAEYACLYGLTYKNDEIDKLKKENEQLKKDIIEIEKLSDSRWEEIERLRTELQYIKFLNCRL